MAYQNTGYARNKTLTVTKGEDTETFRVTDRFADPSDDTVYEALTDQAFQRLTDEEYELRLEAFIRHVYSECDGLQADCPNLAQGSVEYNPTMCPLPSTQQTNQ